MSKPWLQSLRSTLRRRHPAARRSPAAVPLNLERLESRTLLSGGSAGDQLQAAYGQLPLSFEANQGQTDAQVRFLARGSGYGLFLTPTEAVLSLQKPAATDSTQAGPALSSGGDGKLVSVHFSENWCGSCGRVSRIATEPWQLGGLPRR